MRDEQSGSRDPGQTNRTFTSIENAEKMEVLVGMYEQLDQNHHHHNKIIFQTYYLSVIFFGAVGSIILDSQHSTQITAGIAVFGALVMLVLGFWAYMYIKARRQIKESKSNVLDELEQHNEEFVTMDNVREGFFFKHESTPERTILAKVLTYLGRDVDGDFLGVEHKKDTVQWAYFLVLSLLFFGFAGWLLIPDTFPIS